MPTELLPRNQTVRYQRESDAPPRAKASLTALRALMPHHPIPYSKACALVQRQAHLLLTLRRDTLPVQIEIISDLPRVRVEYLTDQTSPGATFFNTENKQWVIQLSCTETWQQQRFIAARELKHILDSGYTRLLYRGSSHLSGADQARQAADYFARCLLVPARLLRLAWRVGVENATDLALMFCVTEEVIHDRMRDIRLVRRDAQSTTPEISNNSHKASILLHPEFERNAVWAKEEL